MAQSMVFKSGRKAQITLFIILGLVILFAMIFVVSLTSHITRSQLSQEQEEVTTALFAKEGLRVFVEGCLKDGLREGLVLLGKQGRIWDDQPGGTKPFVQGQTGIKLNPPDESSQVAYALTREVYPNHPEAYPCNDDSDPWPFCRYEFPRTDVGFGVLQLKSSVVRADLERYLTEKTKQCVQQFLQEKINPGARVVEGTMDLKLVLLDDGASVMVRYPFRVSIGGERLFQLASFDFFYPTRFKQLLDVGVLKPLDNDYKFVDFKYNDITLHSPSFPYRSEHDLGNCNPEEDHFLCNQNQLSDRWQSLGGTLQSVALANGDTLFSVEIPALTILDGPEPYLFRFVRQNRPPALDYINQQQCLKGLDTDYDYLIIKGHETLGSTTIPISAMDPDEDENIDFEFALRNDDLQLLGAFISAEGIALSQDVQPGLYSFGVKAIDYFGLEDTQTVRLLVDRPLTLDLSFFTYDDFFPSEYNGITVVSAEDPVTMTVDLPRESFSDSIDETVLLTYSDGGVDVAIIPISLPRSQQGSSNILFSLCYLFPFFRESHYCSFPFSYSPEQHIRTMVNPFVHQAPIFSTPTTNGKITLSYGASYCSALPDEKIVEKEVVVTQCIPHKNPAHPYSYPYHQYEFGVNVDGSTNLAQYIGNSNVFDPFQATHSCCYGVLDDPGTWEPKLAGETCFINPRQDCYNNNYVIEEEYAECDGFRGNTCGEDKKYRYPNNELRCGKNDGSNPSCFEISSACEGQKAFGFSQDPITKEKGWCSGVMGCEPFCTKPVVFFQGAEPDSRPLDNTLHLLNLNSLALDNGITNSESFGLYCGCEAWMGDSSCDANFNGKFAGKCNTQTLACEGDS